MHQLTTIDGAAIAAREFIGPAGAHERCLIVVPGFAQHSGTTTFTRLCAQLARRGEIGRVVCTSVNRIIWEGAALRHSLHVLCHPGELKKERDLRFRWGNPLAEKPRADQFATRARQPLHFMVGTSDLLVPPEMSRRVFEAAPPPKTWTVHERGPHAELLYFANPSKFQNWILSTEA